MSKHAYVPHMTLRAHPAAPWRQPRGLDCRGQAGAQHVQSSRAPEEQDEQPHHPCASRLRDEVACNDERYEKHRHAASEPRLGPYEDQHEQTWFRNQQAQGRSIMRSAC